MNAWKDFQFILKFGPGLMHLKSHVKESFKNIEFYVMVSSSVATTALVLYFCFFKSSLVNIQKHGTENCIELWA